MNCFDLAVAYWKMLFSGNPTNKHSQKFKFLDLWLKFLDERSNQRSITKDTWDLLLDFSTTIRPDFSNYDHDGAWPTYVEITKLILLNISFAFLV
jgi:DCN1-like protein 1/2